MADEDDIERIPINELRQVKKKAHMNWQRRRIWSRT